MENKFGVAYKFGNENYTKGLEWDNLHDAKAEAGKWFNREICTSVCVYDGDGVSWLYLKKDASGKCVKREERDW